MIKTTWTVGFALALSACATDGVDEDAGHEEEHDPAEEACEHMEEGPSAAHTATLVAPYPDVSAEHTRHDVTLVDDGGQNGGAVVVEIEEAGDYIVFLDKDMPVAFLDASGNALTIEHDEPVDLCDAVARQKHVEFAVGSVEIRFGPTTETNVRLVVEEGGEGDH